MKHVHPHHRDPQRSPIRRWAASLVLLVCAISPAAAQSVADFYHGRQMILMVGSSPGGGYDAVARLIARNLGRHIPGNPNIIVQNTPGGGSITMSNRIYRGTAQDGTILGLVQRGVLLAQFTKQPGVLFDISKFNWIGSVSPEVALVVSWENAEVKTVHDLLTKPLIVGGTGVTSDLEASARMLNATVGAKFKIVSGYAGQADVLLAMERGEVEGSADWSWDEIKTRHASYLEQNKIHLILQDALKKAPDLPDVPLAIDFVKSETDRKVAELYLGAKQIARPIMMGPGVPADRVDAIRKAFMALKDDPEFKADAQKSGIEVDPTPAADIDAYLKLATNAAPEVVRRLTDILNPHR
jgi:tripartite-type tricarboxylate transporter receptor subunit TctC